jgi:hypothetical protein
MKSSAASFETIDNKVLITIRPQSNIKSLIFATKPTTRYYYLSINKFLRSQRIFNTLPNELSFNKIEHE